MNDFEKYIEVCYGTLPLIISVSHGGRKKLNEISDRTNGIVGIDKNTIELAYELIESIKNLFITSQNKIETPSFVISNIHRSKIDLNRPKTEAFERNSTLAEKIYDYYHNKISELISHNLESFNWSLLIDIHGFEKSDRPKGYRDVELILGSNNLKSLYSSSIPKKEWKKSIRGKIIRRFNKLRIPIAPSFWTRDEYVLTGGFITTKYGASGISNSQTLQIEFSDKIRIKDGELRSVVINVLARLLYDEILESSNII